ncbi:hypothetical protein [Sorangium sp. So ce861]|uniref:hypothetical protein n=1 Tax=Sorangium sp. So ce861 TaxID=3133323 RepID=UPI003F61DFB9
MKLRHGIILLGLLVTSGVGAGACSDDDGDGTTATTSTGSGTGGGATGTGTGTGGGATTGTGGATTGTGGAGAGGEGGGDTACADGMLICDDFESYEAQAEPSGKWTVYKAMTGSTVTVDTAMAYSGTKSVKVTTPESSGQDNYKSAMIQFKDAAALPVDGNVIHGRMMFLLESAPDTDVHWTIIDGAGTVPGKDFEGMPYTAVYRYGGQYATDGSSQLMANYDTPGQWTNPPTGPKTDCWHHAEGKVVPVGKWTCVEFTFDGPKNEMRFSMDGTEIPELTMSGTGQGCANDIENYEWTAPEFTSIGFGWESYQTDAPRTMWIDDVVIGTGPIGCPPAK